MGVNHRVKSVFRLPLLARRMMDRSPPPPSTQSTPSPAAKGKQALTVNTSTNEPRPGHGCEPEHEPPLQLLHLYLQDDDDIFIHHPHHHPGVSSPLYSPCTSPPPLSPCNLDDDDDDDDDDYRFQVNTPPTAHVAVSRRNKDVAVVDFAAGPTPPSTTATAPIATARAGTSTDSSTSSSSSSSPSAGTDSNGSGGSRSRLVRIVSWASIKDRCRWRIEQEQELVFAETELARCQKAWSSEQELWLAYIKALNDEKEAHEDFLHHRAKQSGDEQHHFRKVWNRRRSSQDQAPTPTSPKLTSGAGGRLGRLRGR